MPRTVHLADLLAAAEVESPGPGHVELQRICIRRESRTSIFQHPRSSIRFPEIALGRGAVLTFGIGIKRGAWDVLKEPITFEILGEDDSGTAHELYRRTLNAAAPEDRGWIEDRVDLSAWAGSPLRLVFITSGPDGAGCRFGWSAWGEPRIDDGMAPAARSRGHRQPLVVLITADALGADTLGCYGHPSARTPHIDRLAGEAALFTHARAQSPATPASYASLLTGRHPPEHDVWTEWGQVRPGLASLPGWMAAAGYHTTLAYSKPDLSELGSGLADWFQEILPCHSSPSADGALTTRRLERWLDERPDRPGFLWAQYFDTHPPSMPPEPFRSLHYSGDPTDPARRHRPDLIASIRGVESVLALQNALPMLERGVPDRLLAVRLKDTALTLLGRRAWGPDLATHLRQLDAAARQDLEPQAIGAWLESMADRLLAGEVPDGLVPWIRQLLPHLRRIESDILEWLDGVVDARYAMAMHLGSVAYLDSHVGRLVAALRERDLYDRSLVILASPHGEVFDTLGVHFHHHVPFESALRIPLVIKPPAGSAARVGTRIGGIFDGIDLFPTVAELMGGPAPAGVSGTSRARAVVSGQDIPAHPSLAIDLDGATVAWCEEPYKFLRIEVAHRVSDEWSWKGPERLLFDLRDELPERRNRLADLPDVAAALERRMDAELARIGYQ